MTAPAPHPGLASRAGFEVELLAPRGASRADLAAELAARTGGAVRRTFHVDTETSARAGIAAFWHLTPGFEVRDRDGTLLCSLVDDVTIVADLDRRAAPVPGWFRIVTDEPRLLRLVARHADPAAGIGAVLDPVAELFGAPVEVVGGVHRLNDVAGASIALAAGLPGERERPCEVVTPPLTADHAAALDLLLAAARDLGFTVPREAAVHVHLDAAPFRTVEGFSRVVRLFHDERAALWERFGTNRACTRLGPLPAELRGLVDRPWASWEDLRAAAAALPVVKWADVNLTHVLGTVPGPDTLEVRILPGSMDADAIVAAAVELEGLLGLRPPGAGPADQSVGLRTR